MQSFLRSLLMMERVKTLVAAPGNVKIRIARRQTSSKFVSMS